MAAEPRGGDSGDGRRLGFTLKEDPGGPTDVGGDGRMGFVLCLVLVGLWGVGGGVFGFLVGGFYHLAHV